MELRVARTHMHDWLILLLLVVIIAILLLMQPFYRFVGKDMMIDLRYPLKSNTVPFWTIPLYAGVLPLVTFPIVYYRRNDVYDQFLATPNFLNVLFVGVLTWVVMSVVTMKTAKDFLRLMGVPVVDHPAMEKLIFSHGLTDASVEAFRDCALQVVLLGEYPGVKDSWMDLCGSDVTDTGLGLLKDCTNIQALTFNYCDKISELGLKHISGDPFYFFLLHAASLL
ncbi:hypothetical protein Pint_20044 [Pistacia integerrima]|uniref:Uncharacterized protein n=1 Tax=Pistacia integerrima TaxID=434235 RepID=A0ACC0XAT1_9ROSI|nr:hypothetical protein Pint_20044 [Pistacia integerrima]